MLGKDLVRKGIQRQEGEQGQALGEIIMMKP